MRAFLTWSEKKAMQRLLLLCVFGLYIELVRRFVDPITVFGEMPSRICAAMFPWPSLGRYFRVEKVVAESESPYPCSVLIQASTVKHESYSLWMCIPLSMSPPHQPLLQLDQPFSWTTNHDHSIITLALACGTMRIYSRQAASFRWKVVAEETGAGLTQDTQWISTIAGTCRGQVEMMMGSCHDEPMLVGVFNDFSSHRPKTDWWRFGLPRQCAASGRHVALSYPTYRQHDGILDLYQLNPIEQRLERTCTLEAPQQATGFGCCAYLVADRLLVSAPFAPSPLYGAGAIYVYTIATTPPTLIQTLHCPETFAADHQRHLQFGWFMAVSTNGEFLVATVRTIDAERMYVFQYSSRRKRYLYVKTHQLVRSPQHESSPLRCQVTNHGHLIVYDQDRVHWLANSRPK